MTHQKDDINTASKPDAAPARTGWPAGMLQDDSPELSKALAGKPDARMHAREAAQGSRPALTQALAEAYDALLVNHHRAANAVQAAFFLLTDRANEPIIQRFTLDGIASSAAPAGDEERAKFEKWARQFSHKPDLRTDEGQHEHWLYLSAEVHGWWEAWKASASSAAPAGGAVEPLRELVALRGMKDRMASLSACGFVGHATCEGITFGPDFAECERLKGEYARRKPAAWSEAKRVVAALAAAPVVPPELYGDFDKLMSEHPPSEADRQRVRDALAALPVGASSPCGGPGSAASRPEPQPEEPGCEATRPEDRADGADQSNSGETT